MVTAAAFRHKTETVNRQNHFSDETQKDSIGVNVLIKD